MSDTPKDFRLLIKWNNEDAWDVIKPSDAGLSAVECESPAAIIGETRDIYYDGNIFQAKILEIGPQRQMNKKCIQLVNQFKEKHGTVSGRRVSIPNKRFLDSDESGEEDLSNSQKLPKKAKPEKQENLLDKLKKKITSGQDHSCCVSKQLLEDANKKIASLEKENLLLKTEIEGYRTLQNAIDAVEKLQTQAKSVLKYSERRVKALALSTCDEQFSQSVVSIPTTNQIELVPGTSVFIDKRKLENISADAAGDGRKLARNLLSSLFEPSELANHSVTGRSSNAFKSTPKPPVDQERLSAILRYVSNETNADIAKVKASIANKIKEITYCYSKQKGNASS